MVKGHWSGQGVKGHGSRISGHDQGSLVIHWSEVKGHPSGVTGQSQGSLVSGQRALVKGHQSNDFQGSRVMGQ